MGQYYKTVFLGEEPASDAATMIRGWLSAGCGGIKLMEHAYIDNDYVAAVESLLRRGGLFYKTRIVWAGDYADPESVYDIEEDCERTMNLYEACNNENMLGALATVSMDEYPYIVNHTKRMYVDKRNYEKIHPLPLLTAEGNGCGGGDYRGADEMKVGTWARDVISMEKTVEGLNGYTELVFEPVE